MLFEERELTLCIHVVCDWHFVAATGSKDFVSIEITAGSLQVFLAELTGQVVHGCALELLSKRHLFELHGMDATGTGAGSGKSGRYDS